MAVPAVATADSPHCNAAEYRQLDFWIGDWDTFETDAPGGASVARARVEPIAQGCAKDSALVLEGEAHLRDGASVMQRITWKTQDNGVRESAVVSKDGGKTWNPAFDVLFLKRKISQSE